MEFHSSRAAALSISDISTHETGPHIPDTPNPRVENTCRKHLQFREDTPKPNILPACLSFMKKCPIIRPIAVENRPLIDSPSVNAERVSDPTWFVSTGWTQPSSDDHRSTSTGWSPLATEFQLGHLQPRGIPSGLKSQRILPQSHPMPTPTRSVAIELSATASHRLWLFPSRPAPNAWRAAAQRNSPFIDHL